MAGSGAGAAAAASGRSPGRGAPRVAGAVGAVSGRCSPFAAARLRPGRRRSGNRRSSGPGRPQRQRRAAQRPAEAGGRARKWGAGGAPPGNEPRWQLGRHVAPGFKTGEPHPKGAPAPSGLSCSVAPPPARPSGGDFPSGWNLPSESPGRCFHPIETPKLKFAPGTQFKSRLHTVRTR